MESERDLQRATDVDDFFDLSGSSVNRIRKTASPTPRSENSSEAILVANTSIPRLDLFNFETPDFEDSKYVLTSPRSLEACSVLGVKPVDLLYKPLAEFQEELLPQDVPLRTIYNIYDEHEQNRERKLALCREERQRIIENEKKIPRQRTQIVSKSDRPVRMSVPASKISTLRERKHLSQSEEDLDHGSLQRKRTAWTTSVGHKRVTNDEINLRVKELHDESTKLRQELLSRKETRATESRKRGKKLKRSHSTGSLTLAGTAFLNKTNVPEGHPITSTKLMKKVLRKSTDAKSIPVTPRDQKILELMVNKGESVKSQQHARQQQELVWEEQKRREDRLRTETEMKRRKLLAEENRIKHMKKQDMERQRIKKEQQLFEKCKEDREDSKRKWSSLSELQKHVSDLTLLDKMDKDGSWKRIQEWNYKMQEDEEREMKALVQKKIEDDLHTAAQRKQAHLLHKSMNKMMYNRNERRKFECRHIKIENDYTNAVDELQSSLSIKHSHAQSKYEQVVKRREQEIMLSKLEREKRALHAKLSQEKLNAEMEVWRDTLLQHRHLVEKQAKSSVAMNIEMKARKAHEERLKKENKQKKTIKKIKDEVDEWQKITENDLGKKERKVALIQKEKDIMLEQSRQMAYASQRLRNEIRTHYDGESFDQKAYRAELHNRIGVGFSSSTRNISSVRI